MAEARRGHAILCAGIAVQDIMMRVDEFPAPGTKVSASDFIVTGGGCAANAAVAAARLGARAGFSGPLGDDEVSDRIIADLGRGHVDCAGVVRVKGATASVSLILIDAAGEKSIATRRGVNLAAARPADPALLVSSADAVLVDNRFPEFVTPICQAARARGIPVVIDGDKATKADDQLLALGTHVVFSSEGLRGTVGGGDLGAALMQMAKHLNCFLAVTDGPDGMLWLEGKKLHRLPAFNITAVDTLGAGDTFHAAFTLGVLEEREMPDIMRFASAAAAVKCLRFGGNAVTPTRAETDEFLRKNS